MRLRDTKDRRGFLAHTMAAAAAIGASVVSMRASTGAEQTGKGGNGGD
jgi:hypothetical protein